jgi:hypothetical protein
MSGKKYKLYLEMVDAFPPHRLPDDVLRGPERRGSFA